jgi:putative hydrolase of the HAD superfamily
VAANGLLSGVRAVAFDAVGTLITPDPPVAAAYLAAGRRHGSRLTAGEIDSRFRAAFRAEEDRDRTAGWRTNAAREVDRWRKIVAGVLPDVTAPDACYRELWDHFARPAAWRCLPDVGVVIEVLARHGVAVGVASNFDTRLREVIAGLPELARVGPIIVSAEVGWRKPAPAFFEALITAFGNRADEVLVVGDDFENDYAGGTANGLRAVLVARARPGVTTIDRLGELCR